MESMRVITCSRVDTGDGQEYKVSAIQKKTQALLDAIGVNLLRKN